MNYYNPYFFPYQAPAASTGILSRIFGNGINMSSILSGTQKTLGIVNQAIPIVKQMSPVMKNAKTMFKIMNEFKKADTPTKNSNQQPMTNKNLETTKKEEVEIEKKEYNGPTFFM